MSLCLDHDPIQLDRDHGPEMRAGSVVQAPTVRRIIGGAIETAPGATLIAQEADSPIVSRPVLGIAAAEANLLADIASEPEGVLGIVVEGPMVRRAWPAPGPILRVEFHENGICRVVGEVEGHETVLCLSTSSTETDTQRQQKQDNGC